MSFTPASQGTHISQTAALSRWSPVLIRVFVAGSIVIHLAQRELAASDVALGVGSLSLAAGIRSALGGISSARGLKFLSAWGIGCVVAGLFPPDAYGRWDQPPSLSGMIHGVAAIVVFCSFPIAAHRLCRTMAPFQSGRETRVLRALATGSAAGTLLMLACFAPALWNRPPFAFGAVERIVLAINVGWLLLANRGVRNACLVSRASRRSA